jgi:hypothetical protein
MERSPCSEEWGISVTAVLLHICKILPSVLDLLRGFLWDFCKHVWKSERSSRIHSMTNSMEQSPSWEASISQATQEIPRILWNQKVNYRIHKSCPYPDPDQSNLCPLYPTSWRSILILSSHLDLSSGLLPLGFSTKALYAPLLSPTRPTCSVHLCLLIHRTCSTKSVGTVT